MLVIAKGLPTLNNLIIDVMQINSILNGLPLSWKMIVIVLKPYLETSIYISCPTIEGLRGKHKDRQKSQTNDVLSQTISQSYSFYTQAI